MSILEGAGNIPQQAFQQWNDPQGNKLIALNRDGTISCQGIILPSNISPASGVNYSLTTGSIAALGIQGPTTQSAGSPWVGIPNSTRAVGNDMAGPIYQNLTGKPIYISVIIGTVSGTTSYLEVTAYSDSSPSPSTFVAGDSLTTTSIIGLSMGIFFMVLPNNYYQVTVYNGGPGTYDLKAWVEWN